MVRLGDVTQCTLASQDVGVQSAVDIVHAIYLPGKQALHLKAGDAISKVTIAAGIDTPTKVFVFDVLLHKDVFPGQHPALGIYCTAGVFGSGPNRRREIDRLDMLESVQSLGHGLARFHCADTPMHQDMVRFACQQRGWNVDDLRGYRCRIDYPMYSSEIVLSFDLQLFSR